MTQMNRQVVRAVTSVAAFLLVAVSSPVSQASIAPLNCQAILQGVQDVRMEKDIDGRIDIAEQIAATVRANSECGSNEAVVKALISLLSDDVDGVRYEAAIALGDIGPRAKSAVPALYKAMKRSDAILDARSEVMIPTSYSGQAIRYAISKIAGKKIPEYGSKPRPEPESWKLRRRRK